MGDNSAPYPLEMALWDTITNTISMVSHPPGFETYRFFRPTMVTFDESSILLVSGKNYNDTEEGLLTNMFQYIFGVGWIKHENSIAPLNLVAQNGIYMLENPDLGEYNSLDQCNWTTIGMCPHKTQTNLTNTFWNCPIKFRSHANIFDFVSLNILNNIENPKSIKLTKKF